MLIFCIASTSTVSEPGTSATATTVSPRSRDGAASGAYGNGGRRCRVCRGVCVALTKTKGGKSVASWYCLDENVLYTVSLELTFAVQHALKPFVINVFVAGTPAVLVPGTTRSATAVSTGFRERATFGAYLLFNGWWRADRRSGLCPA